MQSSCPLWFTSRVSSLSLRQASLYLFFFFQAEDGIRDGHVTGVQTCALPISASSSRTRVSMTTKPWAPVTGSCQVKIGRASCRERVQAWPGGLYPANKAIEGCCVYDVEDRAAVVAETLPLRRRDAGRAKPRGV